MTNLLSDIVTYVRRIVKAPSNTVLTDNLIVDYINRFTLMDIDARMQLFDFKTTYQFQTTPGVDQYNMPLYDLQSQSTGGASVSIGPLPVYQNFIGPCFINGIQMPFYTQREQFYNVWPNYNQAFLQVGTGDGSVGPYTLSFPFLSNNASSNNTVNNGIIRGHIDLTGIIASYNSGNNGNLSDPPTDISGLGELIQNSTTANKSIPSTSIFPGVYFTTTDTNNENVVIADSGVFLQNKIYGELMSVGHAPYGNLKLLDGGLIGQNYSATQNTINYLTGVATNVYFPTAIPNNMPIMGQCVFYQTGIPRAVLIYNNTLVFRAPPNTQYKIEIGAYLTPAAFFNSGYAIPFGYMAEYISRGAARKILADVGDVEQFNFYEPLFKEQELLVWKRSQRQFTSTRTATIYSQLGFPNTYNQSSFGV